MTPIRLVPVAAGGLAMTAAAGWLLAAFLSSVPDNVPQIRLAAGVCLAGLALCWQPRGRALAAALQPSVSRILAVLAALVGSLTLMQTGSPESLTTAAALVLTGGGILASDVPTAGVPWIGRVRNGLIAAAATLPVLSLLWHLLPAPSPAWALPFGPSVALSLVNAGAIARHEPLLGASWLDAERPSGRMLRFLLPSVLIVPLVAAWVLAGFRRAGLLEGGLDDWYGASIALGLAYAVICAARRLNGADPTPHLQRTIAVLEDSLVRRTADLVNAEESATRQAQLWETVLDSIRDPVVVTDEGGRPSFLNRPARSFFQRKAGSVDHPLDGAAGYLECVATQPLTARPLERVLAGEDVAESMGFLPTAQRPNGTPVEIVAYRLPSLGGGGSGAVQVFRRANPRGVGNG